MPLLAAASLVTVTTSPAFGLVGENFATQEAGVAVALLQSATGPLGFGVGATASAGALPNTNDQAAVPTTARATTERRIQLLTIPTFAAHPGPR